MGKSPDYDWPNLGNYTVSVPQKGEVCKGLVIFETVFPNFNEISARICLDTNGDMVFGNPTTHPKGAEMFCLESPNGNSVGYSLNKYYNWQNLKPQITLISNENGADNFLFLSSFEFATFTKLGAFQARIAIELAYNYIDPFERRNGLGSKMFNLRIARGKWLSTNNATNTLLFTVARGQSTGSGVPHQIFDLLLENEKSINGIGADGRVIITGHKLSLERIKQELSLPEDFDPKAVHHDSLATSILAERKRMKYIGLTRNLSPIYAKTISLNDND